MSPRTGGFWVIPCRFSGPQHLHRPFNLQRGELLTFTGPLGPEAQARLCSLTEAEGQACLHRTS